MSSAWASAWYTVSAQSITIALVIIAFVYLLGGFTDGVDVTCSA